MWRSEPESDSVGVKPGVAALSLASILTNKALRIVALDRYDRSNMRSLPVKRCTTDTLFYLELRVGLEPVNLQFHSE